MPVTTLRAPWSGGDLAASADHLQFRRKTAAQLAAENPLLLPGEPCWEIDTAKGKVGDGTHRYNALTYSFGVTTAGGAMTLAAGTLAGNAGAASGPASGLDATAVRSLIDVPQKSGGTGYDAHVATYDAHVAASGTKAAVTATVTTTNGSDLVTSTTALPVAFDNNAPVSGPGIQPYSYINSMALDRKSFRLSSNPLSMVSLPAAAGAGTGTASVRIIFDNAHGFNLIGIWAANPLTGKTVGWSGSISVTNTLTTPMQWEAAWYKGELWAHSFEFPVAQRLFPLDTYSPIRSHIILPVPSAFQVWSPFPTTTAWDLLSPDATTVGRYKVVAPLESSTQARIVVDWMAVGATAGSGAKLKAQYLNAGVWTDLAENSPASTIEVAIDTGVGPKIGNWGVIDNAALAFAATVGDQLTLRLVGLATSAAGSPSFGSARIQLKP